VLAAVEAHTSEHEQVRFCLRGDLNHSLVVLADRLLIVKPGFHAGTTFGSLVTTIFHRDVTGIQVQTYVMSAWIEISTPSFQGRERKRNRHPRPSDRDVYKLPNCIPIKKRRLSGYREPLASLLDLVRSAKETAAPAAPPLPGQLAELVELRQEGLLTDAEFERAKTLLLERRRSA
jgi:hypothetical protein